METKKQLKIGDRVRIIKCKWNNYPDLPHKNHNGQEAVLKHIHSGGDKIDYQVKLNRNFDNYCYPIEVEPIVDNKPTKQVRIDSGLHQLLKVKAAQEQTTIKTLIEGVLAMEVK